MVKTIIENSAAGMPWGVYDIEYYKLIGGRVCRAGLDRDVPGNYVRVAAMRLGQHEALVAKCKSSPGGMSAYGSERVKQAMHD